MHGFARRRPKKTARRARPTADHAALGGSPAEVLSAVLAEGIEEKPELFLAHRGAVCFVVDGDRDFTVRYGDAEAPLAWGAAPEAGLRFVLDRDCLGRIVDGTIDAEAELGSGALRLEGDLALLPPLFTLIERAQGMVALRAGR
jgi:hypothetical protein